MNDKANRQDKPQPQRAPDFSEQIEKSDRSDRPIDITPTIRDTHPAPTDQPEDTKDDN